MPILALQTEDLSDHSESGDSEQRLVEQNQKKQDVIHCFFWVVKEKRQWMFGRFLGGFLGGKKDVWKVFR